MASQSSTVPPDLQAALDRLFSLQTFGIKLGTGPITALLDEFDNPHLRFPAIHVAGTNGKGSVCAMVASVLREAGLRVGLYTSPHLVRFNERIRINGEAISDERLAVYTREMLPAIERHECTFFEGTTAMGFRYFADEEVDIAVIETGLGGRLDATNILQPIACAITSIGYDHTKHLGETLEQIAFEKAGIIKRDTPAIVGRVAPMLRDVFQEKGRVENATVRFVDDFCRAVYTNISFTDITASFMTDGYELPRLCIGLTGRHQIENARVALGVITTIAERFGIDDTIIRSGFARIRENTGVQGRFEVAGESPRVILDVAHNADGARVLTDTLRSLVGERPVVRFVYGAVQDKNVGEIVRIFKPLVHTLYAVRAESDRSLPSEEIAYRSEQTEIPTVHAGSVESGIHRAIADAAPDDAIVICGSFFVVGEAMEILDAMRKGIGDNGGFITEPDTATTDISQGVMHAVDSDLNTGTDSSVIPEAASAVATEPPNDTEQAARRLTVKEWNASEQPRERLMKLGPSALSDAELLAILLRTGTKNEDVIQVSRNILQRFDGLSNLGSRDYKELQKISGIGPTKAVTLAAAFELARRIKADRFADRPKITGPEDVAAIYVPQLRNMQKEQFHVLILNTANQVLRRELISEGNLNSSIVHPREVYRTAIVENAASIIGLHNHPSGNPTPSREDINITKQLVEAGKIIGIPFHDHIIIAGEEYISLAQKGYL